MTGTKRIGKRLKQMARHSPSPSSEEDTNLETEVAGNPFEKSTGLLGKNIDFLDFSIEAMLFILRNFLKIWDGLRYVL